jgi:hypothetical protein
LRFLIGSCIAIRIATRVVIASPPQGLEYIENMNRKAALRGHERHPAGAVMGIRLVIEVLDHYHGPDARKLWLLAWAEKANDGTRAGWPTREVLARRTGRSAARVSNVATELVTEGVLKRLGGGNRSGPAKFAMLPLGGPAMGSPSPNPSLDVEGSPSPNPSDPPEEFAQSEPIRDQKGSESERKGSESGIKGSGSNPQPAETGSLPLIVSSVEQPSEDLLADADAPTAQTILGNFIDWVRSNGGELTARTKGHLARQIGELLAQGIPDRFIRQGLADWQASGQHSSTLDSFVNAAVNAPARGRAGPASRREQERQAQAARAMARARARARQETT